MFKIVGKWWNDKNIELVEIGEDEFKIIDYIVID